MPFTFSHPAIVLPFIKSNPNKLSMTGLIVGSMAPDFEYFFRMKMMRTHGHDLDAILWFNLPICIILAIIYHGIVRSALIRHLPHVLSSRLVVFDTINWFTWLKSYWYVFVYSALIGIFSHLLWDSGTHAEGLFGSAPQLLRHSINIGFSSVPVFVILQALSSLFGALYIIRFIWRLPSLARPYQPLLNKFMFWMVVLITFSFIILVRDPADISTLIATGISATLIGIIVSAIFTPLYETVFTRKNSKF